MAVKKPLHAKMGDESLSTAGGLHDGRPVRSREALANVIHDRCAVRESGIRPRRSLPIADASIRRSAVAVPGTGVR
jgi:hypothetical protein